MIFKKKTILTFLIGILSVCLSVSLSVRPSVTFRYWMKTLYLANDTRCAIVTMEGEQELVCDPSNGAISNDIERTLTLFLRSHHYSMLNISQTATYSYYRKHIENRINDLE